MLKTTKQADQLWRVTWGITLLAKDPTSAAKKAKRYQLKLTGAGVFDVRDARGHLTVVNLDDQ